LPVEYDIASFFEHSYKLLSMLKIGPYELKSRVILAPMAGVSDLPFRRLCMEFGAGLAVGEMISCNPALRNTRKTLLRSRHDGETGPRSVQIAGNDPEEMAAAAHYNVARGAQIIDINMGCPAKKVCRKAAGSALLQDEVLVKSILDAVVNAVDVPVTLKIRTGSSPEKRNGVAIARIAQDCGISALAVHGRTRSCAFRGEVEYDTIADIVKAVELPVFANGDINSPEQAWSVMKYTGAAAVMVGRAAQGQPWICGQMAAQLASGATLAAPTTAEKFDTISRHINAIHAFYGEVLGVRIARKHMGWYMQYINRDPAMRRAFNALQTSGEQLRAIEHYSHICADNFIENEVLAA
jgi:tRNA-dihydrouridine synthase B